MGGYGSGRRSHRSTIEDYRQLDVNQLAREGIIKGGFVRHSDWQWLRKGEVIATICLEARGYLPSPYIRLFYTWNKNEDIDYRVPLTRTYPPFGGSRWWFVCPGSGCGRRVGKLYGGRYFLCRHCHDLRYLSQREVYHFRLISKAQKIRIKLDGSANITLPFPDKPKGMHWKTYNSLSLKAREAVHDSLMITAARLGLDIGS